MRVLKIFAVILLIIFVAQGKTFAEMPDITYKESYFDIFKGVQIFRGGVRVSMNNRNFKGTLNADEARVNMQKQICWADGKVKLVQDDVNLACDRAYIVLQEKTATVTGKIKFDSKKNITVTADSAIFNWGTKIVDFYGKIKLKTDKNVKFSDGVKLNGKDYRHVRYNVVEKKILALDKTFDVPKVVIPTE